MATQWLREINTAATGVSTGFPFGIKCLALFLQNCLGFTNFSQIVTGGNYNTTEKSGINGSINITGSDKNFEDLVAASFVAGDVGKYLILQDASNPENAGIYKITAQPSTTRITIDYRSGAAEYPTQNLGANLNWWLLADNYDVPTTANDLFRLRTPHANGWEIEVAYSLPTGDQRIDVRIAADASWAGSKILNTVYAGVDNGDATWFYCAGDSGGEFVHFFFHNSTSSQYGGFAAGNVDLVEPDRVATEQVALMGNQSSSLYNTNTFERIHDNSNITRGSVYDEQAAKAVEVRMVDPSYSLSSVSLPVWTSRQINQRTGNWDFIGQPIIADVDNAEDIGRFEIVGNLKGFLLCSQQAGDKTALDDAGTKDRFHVFDGHAVEWPGVTQQH